ncbi:MAG: SRPBCC family protein [Phenylobacterium sp.]|uniref:SRPBCC family protein n=1 Tax=Phenylobacterium sp. TaxID=1871053 RepID=UPI00391DA762
MKSMICAAAAATVLAGTAHAEVTRRSETGFTVVHKAQVAASPAAAYAALGRVGAWWDDAHTYSGKASNMTMPLEAGGCFCERLEGGGGVRHGVVVLALPGRTLRLDSALGPLQGEGVSGALTFALQPRDGGTEVVLTYNVGGYGPEGVKQWAEAVDQVLGVQLGRFARHVATSGP